MAEEYALLEWRADSDDNAVHDGVDSFVIRNGKIVMQAVHYTLRRPAAYDRRRQVELP